MEDPRGSLDAPHRPREGKQCLEARHLFLEARPPVLEVAPLFRRTTCRRHGARRGVGESAPHLLEEQRSCFEAATRCRSSMRLDRTATTRVLTNAPHVRESRGCFLEGEHGDLESRSPFLESQRRCLEVARASLVSQPDVLTSKRPFLTSVTRSLETQHGSPTTATISLSTLRRRPLSAHGRLDSTRAFLDFLRDFLDFGDAVQATSLRSRRSAPGLFYPQPLRFASASPSPRDRGREEPWARHCNAARFVSR